MTTEALQHLLREVWGYPDFRPGQAEIVLHCAQGKDGIALLPTGGGKSLCYQVPGLAREACTLVISPLISLMEDQVADLQARGIPALSLAGDIDAKAWDQVMDRAIGGAYSFLYLSPERALSARFMARIPYLPLGLLAIDEAHCISQWGHDFRPSYTSLGRLREQLRDIPCLAVTASATPEVLADIQSLLLLDDARVFRQSFARPNVQIRIHPTSQREHTLLQLLRPKDGKQIIYTRSRSQTVHWAKRLQEQGILAGAYHAGMTAEDRSAQQSAWMGDGLTTMVATNAFGMGIDQAHVRQVFHLDIPDSPESYYQEIGRAGRDGEMAEAHFLLDSRVQSTFEKRLKEESVSWEDLSWVYNQLGSLGQIAVGDGFQVRQSIDMDGLALRWNKPRRWIALALQSLEREGIFRLNEGWKDQARIQLLLHGEALVRAAESLPGHGHVAYALARMEPGARSEFTAFSPKALAHRVDMPIPALYASLNALTHAGILHWEHQESNIQITWLMARAAEGYLPISRKKIQDLRTSKGHRANAMLRLLHGPGCRMRHILDYFGEKDYPECGCCDRCTQSQSRGRMALLAHILTLLQEKSSSARELKFALPDAPQDIDTALREGIQRHLWERSTHGIYQIV